MNIEFRNFNLPISVMGVSIFIIIMAVTYFLLFKEHHKRNKMEFFEIFPLLINYFVLFIISFFLLLYGLDTLLTGYVYNEEIYEVIKELATGIIIISLVILNFIFYVKKHNQDLVQEVREEKKKKDLKLGEWSEIIVFLIVIGMSIYNIYTYSQYIDESLKYRQTIGAVLCIVVTLFLWYNLNPLDTAEKFKDLFKKKKSIDENQEDEDKEEK